VGKSYTDIVTDQSLWKGISTKWCLITRISSVEKGKNNTRLCKEEISAMWDKQYKPNTVNKSKERT
jgi:hypothetical protein